MEAKGLTPILNVSDIASTFAWFEKWGWKKLWDWGTPPTFGAVGSGKECIFLGQGAQGGRGRGANTTTFQQQGDEEGDKGVWMSVWVDDVDEMPSSALPPGWRSHFRPPICRGTSARCIFVIQMATYSGSAEDSRTKGRNPKLRMSGLVSTLALNAESPKANGRPLSPGATADIEWVMKSSTQWAKTIRPRDPNAILFREHRPNQEASRPKSTETTAISRLCSHHAE